MHALKSFSGEFYPQGTLHTLQISNNPMMKGLNTVTKQYTEDGENELTLAVLPSAKYEVVSMNNCKILKVCIKFQCIELEFGKM